MTAAARQTPNFTSATKALLGAAPRKSRRLHGGDLTDVFALSLTDGRTVVAKTGGHVAIEANMLRALAAAHAPVPQVLANDAGILFLEYLPEIQNSAAGWQSLGTALRALHHHHGDHYGWSADYAFGKVRIHNQMQDNWPDFWAQNRLLPNLRHLPTALGQRIETLARRLPDLLPAHPPASLLHGDLWSGNLLFTNQRAWLIDPACYYGDAEVDLAMLSLFGAPGADFHAAYGPLAAAADQRMPIYQLWPALVHLRLFGKRYHSLVERCLNAVGA